jgi:hypothetical protein
MEEDEKARKELLALARQSIRNLDLLIAQCDSWLPEEEGRRNMHIAYVARRKAERKEARKRFFSKLKRICMFKIVSCN